MKDADLRQQIRDWHKTTYGEMPQSRLDNGRYKQNPSIETTRRILETQGLINKSMTGGSTSGLDVTEREVGDFKYVKVFNIISEAKDWTPMDMVYGTCFLAQRDPNVKLMARQWNLTEEELISKMCGRALRALPSYLREHDLKQQLERRLPKAEFRQDEKLDTILHADLAMNYKGEKYYFWSFVNTYQSLQNFQDKFLGHRKGMILDGYHVICPFSLGVCDSINGWKLYNDLSIDNIVRLVNGPVQAEYKDIEEIIDTNSKYFQTPKLIEKVNERELEYEEEYELAIGI